MTAVEVEPPRTRTTWVGQPLKRREDLRVLQGKGQYIGDMYRPGMLYAHFVRSTHAHARLLSLDLAKALAVPGVVAGFTGDDLVGIGMREMLVPSLVPNMPDELRIPPSLPVAVGKTVFHGEPIAVLLAEDRFALEDAAELVEVHYDALPILVDPERALEEGAPRVHEAWPDNVIYRSKTGNGGADEAFAQADIVVEERFAVPRTGCSPMEPRGVLTEWSDDTGLSHWSTTQRPHLLRQAISEVLGIPEHRVRVMVPRDQGGAFGTKAPLSREDFALALIAKHVKRPVRWIETREEHFRAGIGQERGQTHYMQVAATRDGKILGIRDRCVADIGDGNQPVFLGIMYPRTGVFWMPGIYDIPALEVELICVATNKPVLTPSRAFGSLPARFAIDRIVDRLARELDLDPVEVRRKNLVKEFPHLTATGNFYDSGDFVGAYEKLLDLVDIEELRREQAALREEGRYIGVGFGGEAEMSGVPSLGYVPRQGKPGYGAATVRVLPSGKVLVLLGDPPSGQSHETAISQVMADEFGVDPADVMLEYGDTWTTPFGIGNVGNRMASYTVSAAVLAARELKTKLATVAAHDLGIDAEPAEFVFLDGQIALEASPTESIALSAVAGHIILTPLGLPPGVGPGLEHTAYYEPPEGVFNMTSSSFHAAVVEVDPLSGSFEILRYVVVDDCGTPINPLVVEGQVQGGVVQGLGNSILEEFVYNERGELQNTTLEGYLMPSAADVPHVENHEHNVPTPFNPLGTKGKGEGAPGPVPGTLANAIEDALVPFGVKLTELPLRPERIWRTVAATLPTVEVEADRSPTEPATAVVVEGEHELLSELRRLYANVKITLQPTWHPFVDQIAMWYADYDHALARAAACPESLDYLEGLLEGRAEPHFSESAAADVAAAWNRLEVLPRPDGQHLYLDDIMPALEAHELLLIALSHTATD